MIYLSSDRTDFISSDTFAGCGIGYTEEDGPDTLMDRCAAALEEK